MILNGSTFSSHRQSPTVSGSLPNGTVVSSNSARCHRARTGDTSGRQSPFEGLPETVGFTLRGGASRMNESFVHDSVMLQEILGVFSAMNTGVFVDCTLGGAGHTSAILSAHAELKALGIDQDDIALSSAHSVLDDAGLSERATLRRARFDEVSRIVAEEGIQSAAGILFDLGVSSPQFDVAERGFSYRLDAPLDMRMDRSREFSANNVVNEYDVDALINMLRTNADERYAVRIARAIVAARPILSTVQLSEVVSSAIPAPARRRGGHPAKRTFQAIRIEVNSELAILPGAIRDAISLLAPGARLAVLTFHSGEDRIVKSIMRSAETGDCTCPVGLPCACGAQRTVSRVRVPREAGKEELARNPRASSARLRVVEKLSAEEPK